MGTPDTRALPVSVRRRRSLVAALACCLRGTGNQLNVPGGLLKGSAKWLESATW